MNHTAWQTYKRDVDVSMINGNDLYIAISRPVPRDDLPCMPLIIIG
jgi:hypothetical protein